MTRAAMVGNARLADLLRARKPQILEAWSKVVRECVAARDLPADKLIDTMPETLDVLARVAERGTMKGEEHSIALCSESHAHERLQLGYSVGELVDEYLKLRAVLFDTLEDAWPTIRVDEWRCVTLAIDQEIAQVYDRFARARDKKVAALERVSTGGFAASTLEELLENVLSIVLDAVPAMDTVTILLREGNSLRVRASRGLEEEINRGFSIAIGDGFAGTIASTRKPILIHDAQSDPLVRSDVIRERGIRALYGVALVNDDELVGVAHMGSRNAYDFAEEDIILFRGLANRATAIIAKQRALEAMREQAALRERFLAIVSHDLRTPLQSIVGSARILSVGTQLEDPGKRAVARIERSADRIQRLIEDVLDFARARLGGGIAVNVAPIDLNALCRHVVEEVRSARGGRTIRLEGAVSSVVSCDRDRMAQAISNVISNALEHSAEGAPVDVRLADAGPSHVAVTVRNEGAPIPPEQLPHLFEPFRRGSNKPGGTGLGLFIVQSIVTAHGGSVEALSSAEGGTTFTLRIPREPPR